MDLRVTNYDLRIERVLLTPMLMRAKASGNEWAACYSEQGIFGLTSDELRFTNGEGAAYADADASESFRQ